MTEENLVVNENATKLAMEVIVSEEDSSVYVKLSGFDDIDDADKYADYLTENLPLMLFQTKVMH
jgi:hypothetical protein